MLLLKGFESNVGKGDATSEWTIWHYCGSHRWYKIRDKYIDRLDILEKVKALFLIPEVNLTSTGMVAKFFDVPNTIRAAYNRHTQELIEEGAKTLKTNEVFNSFTVKPSNFERVW